MIELELANLNRVAEWRGKFCLKAANQKLRKGDFAGKPSKLVKGVCSGSPKKNDFLQVFT